MDNRPPPAEILLELQTRFPLWEMLPGHKRILVLELWGRGMDVTSTATTVGASRDWVLEVRRTWTTHGLEAMLHEPIDPGGRPPIPEVLSTQIVEFVSARLRSKSLVTVRYTARALGTSVGTVARVLQGAGIKTNGVPRGPGRRRVRAAVAD